MTELKQQALKKMLEEMNLKHSMAVEQVHNWICEQDDESLFTNILKAGKTIANGIQYAAGKARAAAMSGVAFTTDDEVYQWVVEYFASDEKEVKQVARVESAPTEKVAIVGEGAKVAKITEAIIKKHEAQKKVTKPEEPQLNIFDFLEPAKKTQSEVIAEIKAEAKANAWEDDIMPDDLDDEVTEDEADE